MDLFAYQIVPPVSFHRFGLLGAPQQHTAQWLHRRTSIFDLNCQSKAQCWHQSNILMLHDSSTLHTQLHAFVTTLEIIIDGHCHRFQTLLSSWASSSRQLQNSVPSQKDIL